MIDHLTIHVTDYEASKALFLAALAPLGYELVMEFGDDNMKFCGIGPNQQPNVWLAPSDEVRPYHLAFRANSQAEVDAFYSAALEAGAKDNGAPGPRPQYHANYYAAFVLDGDGYNLEAVIHDHEA